MARAKKKESYSATATRLEQGLFVPQFAGESFASEAFGSRLGLSRTSSNTLDGNVKGGQLQNIRDGVFPFEKNSDGSSIAVKDVIVLCQKAYYNVPIFRLTIDIMTEFANSRLFFKGENKEAIKFFEKWWDKIGGWKLGDQFFREWFRSGNVFLYKLESQLGTINGRKSRLPQGVYIPMRYIVMNAADIRCDSAASFIDSSYHKVLNSYEAARLKARKTDADKQLYDSLPQKTQSEINKAQTGLNAEIKVPLDPDKVMAIFCKKQDYEGMAVPMYYPVLADINLKLEFKKAELVVAKTVDYIILLITMGESEKDGGRGVDATLINTTQELFQNQSVGRVLVSDYTTEMEFVMPDLNKILGPDKYKVVNQDIADGLMNIFFSENKFADSMIKIKMFLERLNEARKAFIQLFLKPEMEAIAKKLKFKSIPDVEFETIDLKNEVEYYKVYTRLAELGLLTPEETFNAFKYNQLPLAEDSLESQKKFKKQKDAGYYSMQTANKPMEGQGRPTGTKAPQTKKNVQPAGASTHFSLSLIHDNVKEFDNILNKAFEYYKEKNEKQRLHKKSKENVRKKIWEMFGNEPKENWEDKYKEYIDSPQPPNIAIASEIAEISATHQVTYELATILFNSKRDKPEDLEIFDNDEV